MSEPRTEALWTDPAPRTPEGQRLWGLFRDGKLGPSPFGIRDFGQRICQIEAEAQAAHNAELAAKVRGITWEDERIDDEDVDGFLRGFREAKAAVLALLEPRLFETAIADPATKAALDKGLADLAAGRVKPWEPTGTKIPPLPAPNRSLLGKP